MKNNMCKVVEFKPCYQKSVCLFLDKCLPESGRKFDPRMHHREFMDIAHNFEKFWCLFEDGVLIGTVAVRRMNDKEAELKSLYLFEKYHGRGLGRLLLETALKYAKDREYKTVFLDTTSSSEKAVRLYRKAGFVITDRYNENKTADIFMKLPL